ncbi:hypothetical protein L226DRAFT_572740 [Lentinus tigrinus ALCF2SS1-7]|uniref:HNH nuclease domain-containing protein n=1 Tax=Lentinus tigrinus ALCF2SS1-6 TaxID=1328759 RepID=A0A5C2S5E6_9APHY|nr:hypothetical protein L227DRAFT_191522 [Lentinus tigrinus ALCF2SS1-6]RPD72961.1 hypothetical protein L226DRAFT_572740 [Lentinus tigrinus ALCF2SS1-7]
MAHWTSFARPLLDEPQAQTHCLDEFPGLHRRQKFLKRLMRVYSSVLQAETAAKERPPDLIRSRLVGYFVLYAPDLKALMAIVNELRSLQRDAADPESFNDACYRLGDEILDKFVRPFRGQRCDRDTDSSEVLEAWGDDEEEEEVPPSCLAELVEQSGRHLASARLAGVLRERYRCPVTGSFDLDSMQDSTVLKYLESHPDASVTSMCVHHIIPDLETDLAGWDVHFDNGPMSNEDHWRFWERFGHPELREELAGRLHRVENVIMLDRYICQMVDELRLCFKPVHGKVHAFDLVLFGPNADKYKRFLRLPDQKSMFNTSVDIPKPDLKYLRILATCCFVANLSGAIEYKHYITFNSRLVELS